MNYNEYILDECNPVHEFKCISDGLCINKSRMCDGVAQCIDGSDEPPSCSEFNYICSNQLISLLPWMYTYILYTAR